jgi:hypothetical protein
MAVCNAIITSSDPLPLPQTLQSVNPLIITWLFEHLNIHLHFQLICHHSCLHDSSSKMLPCHPTPNLPHWVVHYQNVPTCPITFVIASNDIGLRHLV